MYAPTHISITILIIIANNVHVCVRVCVRARVLICVYVVVVVAVFVVIVVGHTYDKVQRLVRYLFKQ